MATLTLIANAAAHGARTALVCPVGAMSYAQLLERSGAVSRALLEGEAGRSDLDGARIAFLVPSGVDHVAVQWGVWRAGGIAVPLAVSHPVPELEYVVRDSGAEVLVADASTSERAAAVAAAVGIPLRMVGEMSDAAGDATLPDIAPGRPALMIYTSGTTGRPKGVVTTHANLRAQVEALVEAWGWVPEDRILHVLPLHHVHGIVNALTCPLWVGATCELLPAFEAATVWDRLASGEVSVFMAVPTIYRRLIACWEEASVPDRERWSAGVRGLRLAVSGSAALPVATFEHWRAISGHALLERYGMTEIGMGLSNPYEGERRPGTVGQPLPGAQVRLVDDEGSPVAAGTPGEIEIRGPQVFAEYWERPLETAAAFREGWFRTGDEAILEDGYYRILGRRSVDIIKSGGYKLSALEIEEVLREHPSVVDCAVVGVPDPEWGERVCAAAVVQPGELLDPESLRDWARQRMAPYKIPREVLVVTALPRNAMGKVMKREIRALFEPGLP